MGLILRLGQSTTIQIKWPLAMEINMISLIKGNYLMYQGQFITIMIKIRFHTLVEINTKLYQDFTTNMTNGNIHAMMVWITIFMEEKVKDPVPI